MSRIRVPLTPAAHRPHLHAGIASAASAFVFWVRVGSLGPSDLATYLLAVAIALTFAELLRLILAFVRGVHAAGEEVRAAIADADPNARKKPKHLRAAVGLAGALATDAPLVAGVCVAAGEGVSIGGAGAFAVVAPVAHSALAAWRLRRAFRDVAGEGAGAPIQTSTPPVPSHAALEGGVARVAVVDVEGLKDGKVGALQDR